MLEVLNIVLTFSPLLAILYLANLAQRGRERETPLPALAWASYLMLAILYVVLLLAGLAFLIGGVSPGAIMGAADEAGAVPASGSTLWLSFGLVLPSIVGLILLLKPVRRLVARFLAIDSDHPVHAVALSMTMLPIAMLGLALGVGLDTLATQLAAQSEETGADPFSLATLWAQAFMFLLIALVGVGWLTRRSWSETLARLGLVRPTLREAGIGVAAALLLVPAVTGLEALLSLAGLGVGEDIESLSELLLGPLFATPFGIISVGLAAAIGEEPVFRGAAQPRFGLLLTSALFALTHSQYGISAATLIVLMLGLVLGIIRQRTNTTTALITHAVYNSTLGALAYVAAQVLAQQS